MDWDDVVDLHEAGKTNRSLDDLRELYDADELPNLRNDQYNHHSYSGRNGYRSTVNQVSHSAQQMQNGNGSFTRFLVRFWRYLWCIHPLAAIGVYFIAPLSLLSMQYPSQAEFNVTEALRCASEKPCLFSETFACDGDHPKCSKSIQAGITQRWEAIEAKYRKKTTHH
jgi:hypothetical protein